MTAETAQDGPDLTTGDQDFDGYTAAFERGEAALLGHLVLYSVYEADVTRDDIERWFRELELDEEFLPKPLRACDAFEKVTGPSGVRRSYPLDDPLQVGERKEKAKEERGQKALLMVRHVAHDDGDIERHVVREVRDTSEKRLAYDTQLAVCRFWRDREPESDRGAGRMTVKPDELAIAGLPEEEQGVVRGMLFEIEEQYRRRCKYLSADKLRGIVRAYVESLNGVKVRNGGGTYFVHRQHAETLAALRALVQRFEGESQFIRIPLPDQAEMREMVVSAFTSKAKEDLDKLALDLAKARRENKGGRVINELHRRFMELKAATGEHTRLLSTSLGETEASLELVNLQLATLMSTATDDE
jgi:hypothetical protein